MADANWGMAAEAYICGCITVPSMHPAAESTILRYMMSSTTVPERTAPSQMRTASPKLPTSIRAMPLSTGSSGMSMPVWPILAGPWWPVTK